MREMGFIRFSQKPLGMGNGAGVGLDALAVVAESPKMWLATAIGAGLSVASSLFGGMKASQAAKRAEERQRQREEEENAYYRRRYNEDYADTAAGQNLIRRAKEYARENWRKAAGAQAVAGGTDAATAMAKEAGNKMVGDTIANIAATDEARKAQVDAAHQQALSDFARQDIQREQQRAQNITQASSAASNAMLQGATAFEGVSLKGGNNQGTARQPLNIPQDKPDGGTVTLKSNVQGIGGDYEADDLRRKMGLPT